MNRGVVLYNKKLLLAVGLFLLICIAGCGKGSDLYEQISQEEAKRIMDTESDYIIVDARTEAEYSEGHIDGAICIPNETINDTEPEQLPQKDQLVLIYCRSGRRSKEAAKKLAKLGYSNIKEFGGIITWPY